MMLTSANIPYGAKLYFDNDSEVKKGDVICEWDPFNAVIVSEVGGKVRYDNLTEGITYRVDADEQTGISEKIIIESKERGEGARGHHRSPRRRRFSSTYALPVGAHLMVERRRFRQGRRGIRQDSPCHR